MLVLCKLPSGTCMPLKHRHLWQIGMESQGNRRFANLRLPCDSIPICHKCLCFNGMHVPEGSLHSTSMTVWNLLWQRVFNHLRIVFLRQGTHLAAAAKE